MSSGQDTESTRAAIAVIGGGIAGLTTAYRLAQREHRVTLWDPSAQLGGQAAAFPVPGGHLEFFYHHLFMSDRSIVALIEELGIEDHLVWLSSKNGFFADGKIYSLAGARDLLSLPIIPFIDRLRLGFVTLFLQKTTPQGDRWKKFERVTAWEWLRRASGERAFDRIWAMQLRAKFGPRAEHVAMSWFWNKIYLRTQSREGLLGEEKLGYIMGSFNVLIDRLAGACREQGVDIRAGCGVNEIKQVDGDKPQFEVRDAHGRAEIVDRVIATVPSPVLLRLFPDMPEPYRSRLTSAVYQGAVCALLRLDQPLSDTYWMNIADERLPFTGIIEHTNFIGPEHYDGNHYVYVSKYVDWDHPYVTMSDEELLDEYVPKLQIVNSKFNRSWIQQHWIFRERAAQPIISLNYSEKIPAHQTPIEGLYLANTAQIYPQDRGTNYSVDLGNRIAELVDGDIDRTKAERG
ncbi:NAD(P)/FAD-dependent oxidoreductase [soil metagenome]